MKITKEMADKAAAAGAQVREKPVIKRPKRKKKPNPAPPPQTDSKALEATIAAMESYHKEILTATQAQADALAAMLAAVAEEKPFRLKVVRELNREKPDYLLMKYIDIIPIKYTRKLDS